MTPVARQNNLQAWPRPRLSCPLFAAPSRLEPGALPCLRSRKYGPHLPASAEGLGELLDARRIHRNVRSLSCCDVDEWLLPQQSPRPASGSGSLLAQRPNKSVADLPGTTPQDLFLRVNNSVGPFVWLGKRITRTIIAMLTKLSALRFVPPSTSRFRVIFYALHQYLRIHRL
jgi:hypothetical protein